MIDSTRHRGLREWLEKGRWARIAPDLRKRLVVRLSALQAARTLVELNQPGFDFHPLAGTNPRRYSIHVNGNWCLTFGFENGKVMRLDLEDYHGKRA